MMTLLKIANTTVTLTSKLKLWAKKSWAWIKVNGHVVFIAALGILALVLGRKSVDLSKVMDERKKAYEEEMNSLKASHEKELEDRDAAVRRYQSAIKQVEDKYKSESKKLDSDKKKRIKELIQNNSENPEEITKQIADLTGFTVVDMD